MGIDGRYTRAARTGPVVVGNAPAQHAFDVEHQGSEVAGIE